MLFYVCILIIAIEQLTAICLAIKVFFVFLDFKFILQNLETFEYANALDCKVK